MANQQIVLDIHDICQYMGLSTKKAREATIINPVKEVKANG